MCSREPPSARESAATFRKRGYRLWPIAVLGAGLALFFASGLDDYLTFEMLRENRAEVLAWVDRAGVVGVVVFAALYAVTIAFSLPLGALFTIVGGFLFGPVVGTVAAVCGATIGATVVFLAARTAFGDVLRSKAGRAIDRMASGFEEDAFNYLLTLRLIPIFPFWLVNIAPAFTRIRLRSYVAATALGIVPGTFVYVLIGNGLGAVFESGERPDLGVVFEPAVLLPILGLALLSLLPVVYRRIRRRRGMAAGEAPRRCRTSPPPSCPRPADDGAKGARGA